MADAVYKLKQADSLPVVKRELALERRTTEVLRMDSVQQQREIGNCRSAEVHYQSLVSGYELVLQLSAARSALQSSDLKALQRKLKGQRLKTGLAGGVAILAIVNTIFHLIQ